MVDDAKIEVSSVSSSGSSEPSGSSAAPGSSPWPSCFGLDRGTSSMRSQPRTARSTRVAVTSTGSAFSSTSVPTSPGTHALGRLELHGDGAALVAEPDRGAAGLVVGGPQARGQAEVGLVAADAAQPDDGEDPAADEHEQRRRRRTRETGRTGASGSGLSTRIGSTPGNVPPGQPVTVENWSTDGDEVLRERRGRRRRTVADVHGVRRARTARRSRRHPRRPPDR